MRLLERLFPFGKLVMAAGSAAVLSPSHLTPSEAGTNFVVCRPVPALANCAKSTISPSSLHRARSLALRSTQPPALIDRSLPPLPSPSPPPPRHQDMRLSITTYTTYSTVHAERLPLFTTCFPPPPPLVCALQPSWRTSLKRNHRRRSRRRRGTTDGTRKEKLRMIGEPQSPQRNRNRRHLHHHHRLRRCLPPSPSRIIRPEQPRRPQKRQL